MIAFTVDGTPATKGSYRAYTVKRKDGRTGARVDHDNKRYRPWAARVGWIARLVMAGRPPIAGPVRVDLTFRIARPKRTKLSAPRPDGDKMERATWDAMSGVVFVDDSQVVAWSGRKEWGDPGVDVTVTEVAP